MSRTFHHITYTRRTPVAVYGDAYHVDWRGRGDACGWPQIHTAGNCPGRDLVAGAPTGSAGAHTWSIGEDLRYSAKQLARTDARPQPQRIRRMFASYRYVRAFPSGVDEGCLLDTRAARSAFRTAARAATTAANALLTDTETDPVDLLDGEVFVLPIYRPRSSARWWAD